ncbi:hypothetical protein AMTRI_Chr04g242780 [Amborella trichopoda]
MITTNAAFISSFHSPLQLRNQPHQLICTCIVRLLSSVEHLVHYLMSISFYCPNLLRIGKCTSPSYIECIQNWLKYVASSNVIAMALRGTQRSLALSFTNIIFYPIFHIGVSLYLFDMEGSRDVTMLLLYC